MNKEQLSIISSVLFVCSFLGLVYTILSIQYQITEPQYKALIGTTLLAVVSVLGWYIADEVL